MGIPFSPEGPVRPREGDSKPEWGRALGSEAKITPDDEQWMSEYLAQHPGQSRGDAVEALRFQRSAETKAGNDIN